MNIQLSEHFTYKNYFVYPALHYYDGIHFHLQCGGRHLCIELVGKSAFASVNLIMPYLMGISALGFMIGTGGSAFVSKTLGEGKKNWQISIFRCWLRLLLSEDLCYLFSVLYL